MTKMKPPQPGKVRIFRNGFRHHITGKWISTGRPIPMDIDASKLK